MIVKNCTRCSLCTSRRNIVSGSGANSRIMFIGEAPGYTEDRLSKPFIGKAGQMLEQFLDNCNFTRDTHYYITNVVKCRPVSNRTPYPDEISACLPYLEQEIAEVQPKIVVLLGNTALKAMFANPRLKVSLSRGIWLGKNKNIMCTYHPSHLIRNSLNEELLLQVVDDFKMLVDKYRLLIDLDHVVKYR